VYLSFPCDFHAIASDPQEPLRFDFFAFGTEDPAFLEDLKQIMQTHMAPDHRILRDETVASLVSHAIAELDGENVYSKELLEAVFTHLLVRLIRGFSQDEHEVLPKKNVTDPVALCYRLMNYIDRHIYTLTGLEELAEATNYNYSYISSLFHKTTSGTLTDYYRRRRMETARLLIIGESFNITQIANLLHYSSIYTFSRAFKDEYGLSPAQYRKDHQAIKAGTQLSKK
jgi:AraC-like DNA-binding protein